MAIEAKLKIVKHKLYTLHNEYVKLYSEKKKHTHTHTHTTCNVASSQSSLQGTSSISTFASGKSSTSEWLTVNVSSCFCLLF